jgi:hypothetical protein
VTLEHIETLITGGRKRSGLLAGLFVVLPVATFWASAECGSPELNVTVPAITDNANVAATAAIPNRPTVREVWQKPL